MLSKVIYTFYLKHRKYPFCAPIFHPLSETESYAYFITSWLKLVIVWIRILSIACHTFRIPHHISHITHHTLQITLHISHITENKCFICFWKSEAEVFCSGLWLKDYESNIFGKSLFSSITWAILGASSYPPGPLNPWTPRGRGGGSQWARPFIVSDHLGVICFWKAPDPSYHLLPNLGKLGLTWLKLAKVG